MDDDNAMVRVKRLWTDANDPGLQIQHGTLLLGGEVLMIGEQESGPLWEVCPPDLLPILPEVYEVAGMPLQKVGEAHEFKVNPWSALAWAVEAKSLADEGRRTPLVWVEILQLGTDQANDLRRLRRSL